ncbi:MAG TPA: DUF4142 domain-containing protein [Gemmatimonadaceae bacterium]|nr:DUF4142 domain-containing protein [Gemmatimonadaceae bacterium]
MKTRHALTAFCLATVVACGGRDTDYDDTAGVRVDSAAGVADLTREYTEAELLGLVGLANEGTIEMAKLAQNMATTPEVKSLAAKAVEGHTALDKKAKDLAAQLNLTPTVPQADESLGEDHRKWMEHLNSTQKGNEWDAAYLDHEIQRHETVLDETKDALNREQRAEVKAFLEEVKTHIEGHIDVYRQTRDKLRA